MDELEAQLEQVEDTLASVDAELKALKEEVNRPDLVVLPPRVEQEPEKVRLIEI